LQRHQAIRVEVATTPEGVSGPLSSGCHWAAISSKSASRLLVTEGRRFAQKGHPVPWVRLFGWARHRWSGPRGQIHHTRRPEPAVSSPGVSSPFRSWSHSRTSSGNPSSQYLDPPPCDDDCISGACSASAQQSNRCAHSRSECRDVGRSIFLL
jgi:hypothetical protein